MNYKINSNISLYMITLFLVGGYLYCMIEVILRGFSHISMFLAGGICFTLIGICNSFLEDKASIWLRMLISSFIITSVELIFGLIVNIWLQLDVWDYSRLPLNLFGQICLIFSMLWFFLSYVAIKLSKIIVNVYRQV